jgi:hypothetical protein
MSQKKTFTSKIALSEAVDDLKLIHGIGRVTEKQLQESGIHTFTQLANQSPEDVAARVPDISAHQVRKRGWISQARTLVKQKIPPKPHKEKEVILASHEHYQNFTLEFLLDEKNKIRRLRITHIQSGDVDTWAGWCLKEVSQFLARHTGARIPLPHPVTKKILPIPSNDKMDLALATMNPSPPPPNEPDGQLPPAIIPPVPAVESPSQRLIHPIRLLKWVTSLPDSESSIQSISQSQPFDVHFILDISKTSLSGCHQLAATGTLFAKKLGSGPRQVAGEAQWVFTPTPILNLVIHNVNLPPGIHRLEAVIGLRPAEEESLTTEINASFQGGLLQVY